MSSIDNTNMEETTSKKGAKKAEAKAKKEAEKERKPAEHEAAAPTSSTFTGEDLAKGHYGGILHSGMVISGKLVYLKEVVEEHVG